MNERIWIRKRDLRNAEPHSGNARIIVDERDAKTAKINGDDLVEYTRASPDSTAALREALEVLQLCRSALKSLPTDALGQDSEEGHYYRDELLAHVERVLPESQEVEDAK